MARDWIWGWIAFLPATLLGFWVLGVTGVRDTAPGAVAGGLALAFTGSIVTGVLWTANRRSVRRAMATGREVELVIRPVDALAKAAVLFPGVFGLTTLIRLLFDWHADRWEDDVVLCGTMAYGYALVLTAYRRPTETDGGKSPG
jgi:hypothetical protein